MPQKTSKPRRTPSYALFDSKYQKIQFISKDDLENKLKDLSQLILSHLSGLEKIGKYQLDSFTLKIALTAGILVLSAEGGVELTYKVPPGTARQSFVLGEDGLVSDYLYNYRSISGPDV